MMRPVLCVRTQTAQVCNGSAPSCIARTKRNASPTTPSPGLLQSTYSLLPKRFKLLQVEIRQRLFAVSFHMPEALFEFPVPGPQCRFGIDIQRPADVNRRKEQIT